MRKSDMKKIMIAITLIDIVIIMVFLLVLEAPTPSINKNASLVTDNQIPTETEPVQEDTVIKSAPVVIEKSDFQGTMEDNVLDLYRKKLVGTWHVSKDMTFKFSADGSYAGFFDSNLSDVNNYTYQCVMQEESPVLYIYNEEKTSMVSYTLILNDEDNVVLHFEAAGIDLELKKEKK